MRKGVDLTMKKISVSLLVFFLLFMLSPVAQATQTAGKDYADLQGNWAGQEVNLLDQLGIMRGTGTNEQGQTVFSPGSLVTRAQIAQVLTNTFKLDYGQIQFIKQPVASDFFRDVDNNSWYADAVVLCAINDIFYTREGYNFEPDGNITRIETANAIYSCFNAKKISIPMVMMMPAYSDTQDLCGDDLKAMVFVNNTGIMKGKDQHFRPNDQLTRAELAAVITRCIDLISLDENNDGDEYSLKPGQELILSLEDNPSTGYAWDFSQPYDTKLLEAVSDKIFVSNTPNGNIVGQGGRTYWAFKALQPGTTELNLRYARPWESTQPAKTFKLTVKIGNTAAAVTADSNTISIGTKGYNNLAQYMGTNMQIPYLQGLANTTVQTQINDRFQKDALDLEKTLQTELNNFVKDAQSNDYPIRDFALYSRFQQGYLNSGLLSLTVDYYQYTGGAHGITERRPYNIDLATGKDLALKDLFTEGYDYAGVINQEIKKQISAEPDMYFDGDMGFKGIGENQNYYLQSGNLVVYFQQYEIAPYAAGIPEFKIPLSQFGDNFKAI